MNNIAKALARNTTIADKKTARVTGDYVGLDVYAEWRTALETAHVAFYHYERAKTSLLAGKVQSVKPEKESAIQAFRTIIALVGEVNGIKLDSSIETMESLSKYAIKDTEKLIGRAETIQSEIKNLNNQLDNVHTGMNPDYIANLEAQLDAKEEELRLEKKKPGSVKKGNTMTKFDGNNGFAYNIEKRLGQAVEGQEAQSYEDIVAEREAKKAVARAKAKARREANKKKTANVTVEVAEAINAQA